MVTRRIGGKWPCHPSDPLSLQNVLRYLLIRGGISIIVRRWQQGSWRQGRGDHCQHGSLQIQKDLELPPYPYSQPHSPRRPEDAILVTTVQSFMSHFLKDDDIGFGEMTLILPEFYPPTKRIRELGVAHKDSGGSAVIKMPDWALNTCFLVHFVLILSCCSLLSPTNIVPYKSLSKFSLQVIPSLSSSKSSEEVYNK